MSVPATSTPRPPEVSQRPLRPNRQSPPLTTLSDAVRRLLKHTPPVAQPMISKVGIRDEAHRARAILRASMKDQQADQR